MTYSDSTLAIDHESDTEVSEMRSKELTSVEPTFREYVDKAKRNKHDWNIPHACMYEALIVFRALIKIATENVGDGRAIRILSHRYYPKFYDQLSNYISDAMDDGVVVEAIVTSSDIDICNNEFLNAIYDNDLGHVITVPPDHPVHSPSLRVHSSSFIVVGDSSYRLRAKHGDAKAIANFNNSTIGGLLLQNFLDIKKSLENAD